MITVSTDPLLKDGDFKLKWKATGGGGGRSIKIRDNISKAFKVKVKEIPQVEVSLPSSFSPSPKSP